MLLVGWVLLGGPLEASLVWGVSHIFHGRIVMPELLTVLGANSEVAGGLLARAGRERVTERRHSFPCCPFA